MCANCRDTLGSCVRKHLAKDCSLKRASYCSACAIYGHTFSECSKKVYDVEFVEQLIPPCILLDNQINTNTLLTKDTISNYTQALNAIGFTNLIYKPMKPTIDVLDNPKAIRDLLKAYGQMPKKDNRNKDKYKVYLEKFAKRAGYNIVYHLEKKDVDILEYE